MLTKSGFTRAVFRPDRAWGDAHGRKDFRWTANGPFWVCGMAQACRCGAPVDGEAAASRGHRDRARRRCAKAGAGGGLESAPPVLPPQDPRRRGPDPSGKPWCPGIGPRSCRDLLRVLHGGRPKRDPWRSGCSRGALQPGPVADLRCQAACGGARHRMLRARGAACRRDRLSQAAHARTQADPVRSAGAEAERPGARSSDSLRRDVPGRSPGADSSG